MDFLNKLGKKASETYQVTKEKTVKFSEEMKLKGKISEARNRINEIYKEIGEAIYTQYKTNNEEPNEEIKQKCEEISSKFDEISKLESDILALKESKKCTKCGSEINQKDEFCPKCGVKQPKQEEKVELKEEIQEDVKDAEVTEIKNTDETENNQ